MKTNNMQLTMKNAHLRHAQAHAGQPRLWLWLALVLTLVGLSALAAPAVTQATTFINGTVPPPPETLTVLVGPVDDVSADTVVVAGISVMRNGALVDERVGPLDSPGAWARIEGNGDGSGGLIAVRIKVLPPVPLIKLTGPLDTLTDTNLTVDSIPLNRTTTTLVIGEPVPTEDRVSVRAAIESTGDLLALQVVKINSVPDDPDDDDDEDEPNKTSLTGVIDSMPQDGLSGTWIVSGVPIEVTADTEIHARVGMLEEGAWVKVKGIVENGTLIAERLKTTHTHQFHKLVGELDQLNEIEVVVDGINIDRSETSAVRGNPQPGGRVVVKMLPTLTGNVEAVLIEARGNQQGPPNQPGLVVRFTGRVDALPAEGLYGQWTIASRSVTVPEGAFIDEHKGTVQVGAFVEVTALLGDNNSLTAVVIVVTRRGDDDDDDDDHGHWRELSGIVESLPNNENLLGDWMVSGIRVIVGERTEIRERNGAVSVGDRVKVRGWLLHDGSIRAKRIEVKEDHNPEITFVGEIEALPGGSLVGTWTVDGRTVEVSDQTVLKEHHGPFAVGKRVKVRGHVGENDVVSAKKIESLPNPEIQFTGAIVSFPDGLVGEWEIGEKTVIATGDTEFKQEHGAFAEQVLVRVKGSLREDGTVDARKIETLGLPRIEYIGEIGELPDNPDLIGLWSIGGRTFEVTEQTELDDHQHNGDNVSAGNDGNDSDNGFAVGVWVKVEGRARADGTYIADKIRILDWD